MQKRFGMLIGSVAVGGVFALLTMPLVTFGQEQTVVRQPGAVYDFDFKDEKPAPAPNVMPRALAPSQSRQTTSRKAPTRRSSDF